MNYYKREQVVMPVRAEVPRCGFLTGANKHRAIDLRKRALQAPISEDNQKQVAFRQLGSRSYPGLCKLSCFLTSSRHPDCLNMPHWLVRQGSDQKQMAHSNQII